MTMNYSQQHEYTRMFQQPAQPVDVAVTGPVETNSTFERALDAAKNVFVIITCLGVLWLVYKVWQVFTVLSAVAEQLSTR